MRHLREQKAFPVSANGFAPLHPSIDRPPRSSRALGLSLRARFVLQTRWPKGPDTTAEHSHCAEPSAHLHPGIGSELLSNAVSCRARVKRAESLNQSSGSRIPIPHQPPIPLTATLVCHLQQLAIPCRLRDLPCSRRDRNHHLNLRKSL